MQTENPGKNTLIVIQKRKIWQIYAGKIKYKIKGASIIFYHINNFKKRNKCTKINQCRILSTEVSGFKL